MRLIDHDRELARLGFKSQRRISRVRLPVHNPDTGRMDGLIEYADDDGAAWKAEALRLRAENAKLRQRVAAIERLQSEASIANAARSRRNRAMLGR